MRFIPRWRKPQSIINRIDGDDAPSRYQPPRLLTLADLDRAAELKRRLDKTALRLQELAEHDAPGSERVVDINLQSEEVLTQRELVQAVLEATRKCWSGWADDLRKLGVDPGLMPMRTVLSTLSGNSGGGGGAGGRAEAAAPTPRAQGGGGRAS